MTIIHRTTSIMMKERKNSASPSISRPGREQQGDFDE